LHPSRTEARLKPRPTCGFAINRLIQWRENMISREELQRRFKLIFNSENNRRTIAGKEVIIHSAA